MASSFRVMILIFCTVGNIWSQPGTLDNSFGVGGVVTTDFGSGLDDLAMSVIMQPDGKILVGGRSGNLEFAVARYNTNGSLDPSFDNDGKATVAFGTYDISNQIILQPDGKIIAVGGKEVGGFDADFALARFNANGTLDNSFGVGGKISMDFGNENKSDMINAVDLQADGKIVVTGFARTGSQSNIALARFNTDGSLDNTFDSDGKLVTVLGSYESRGYSIKIQLDGKIVVAGWVKNPTYNDILVIRYNANGSLDNSFDSDGIVSTAIGSESDNAYSLAIQPDGKILV